MAIEISKRLFTVYDYHRMVDAGILHEDDRVADIQNDCVITYSDIHEKKYQTVRQFPRGNAIAPLLLPGCRIPVAALLP